MDEYDCYPVYLSDELADRHYNGKLVMPVEIVVLDPYILFQPFIHVLRNAKWCSSLSLAPVCL